MITKKQSQNTTLFLIPTTLSSNIDHSVLNNLQLNLISHLKYFVVETPKIARQHLKHLQLNTPIQNLTLYELNKHQQDSNSILKTLIDNNQDVGLISDCGMPGIADPGSTIVRMSHQNKIKVKPLGGNSSILMALISSGVNGQLFTFNGYLPIEYNQRISYIKQMQENIIKYNQSQIFIETPFRNQHLLQNLINTLNNNIILSMAINLTSENEAIISQTISSWKRTKTLPNIHKQEVVFVIGL